MGLYPFHWQAFTNSLTISFTDLLTFGSARFQYGLHLERNAALSNLGNSAQNHGAHSGHMIETFGDDDSRTSSFDHIRVDVVALSRTL